MTGTAGEGRHRAPLDPELDQLTQRGREVLRLIARGHAYQEIGARLFNSVKTVETHVSVLRELQLSNRYELSRWADDRRLVWLSRRRGPATGRSAGRWTGRRG